MKINLKKVRDFNGIHTHGLCIRATKLYHSCYEHPYNGGGQFVEFIILTRERNETYLCGFYTRCLYWVSSQPSPRSNYSPSPPMELMTSQSLPPSSASSVMILSHSIDLAGLAHRKNSLTWHCFLTSNSNQSDKICLPYPRGFHTKQLSHPPMDRSGPGSLLTPSKTASPLVFLRLHWLEHRRCPCSSENLAGTL